MKLIADSGSTKTLWYLTDKAETEIYHTQGYNPNYWTERAIEESLRKDLLPQLDHATFKEVYFYGSGCGTKTGAARMQMVLERIFPLQNTYVHSDMLAAARATCGEEKGICCILGTGSNSCLYDGKSMIDNIPSLGYLLGDQGAGADLGKRLIQAFFYRELPADLQHDFEQTYKLEHNSFIKHIYKIEAPNRYFASFAPFCKTHLKQEFIRELVTDSFNQFLERQPFKYKGSKQLVTHFIGGIAIEFQEILESLFEQHNRRLGKVLRNPFPDLLNYHKS